VSIATTEAIEPSPRRTIEGDCRDGERLRPIEEVAESFPRITPFLPVVDATEKRRVVDRALLPAIEDLLLSRVDEFDTEDEPASRSHGLEEIRRDPLARRVGVKIGHVDHIGFGTGGDKSSRRDATVRRRDLPFEVAEVRVV
jgi:hypothetical protein